MIVNFSTWRDFLAAQSRVHLLQTAEWGELKSSFGWDAERLISGDAGAQILFRRLPLGFSLAYLPKPLAAVYQHPAFWEEVDALCHRKRAVFLKLEPDEWQTPGPTSTDPTPAFRLPGFFPSRYNIQPPRTVVIDLRGTEDEVLARMKQKTRYNIRLAAKKDVLVRPWDDLPAFHRLMLVTGGRDGFGVHSLDYYRRAYDLFHPSGMAELLVAEYAGQPLAALMVFVRAGRAYYLYGASSDAERNRMPTYLLQWEAMRWARARGAEEYDLWGVPDADEETLEAQFETRRDGLWGVYRFKRGFGGQVRRAVQALDRVYHPALYRAYQWLMVRRGAA
ncbi:MAG: peptidoglycan bridge formation glycyltransferase FemA/FemB family protein [Anaerolineales bacterium]